MSNQAIIVRPLPPADPKKPGTPGYPSFEVLLGGDFREYLVASGPAIVLGVYSLTAEEAAANAGPTGVLIGTVKGNLDLLKKFPGHYEIKVDNAKAERPPANAKTPQFGLVFAQSGAKADPSLFGLPNNLARHSPQPESFQAQDHTWYIQLRADALRLASPVFPVSWNRFVVPARFDDAPSCSYDWHAANSVHFYTDGSSDHAGSAGAFHDIRAAIDHAKHFVFIADWSFHPTAILHPAGNTLHDTIGGLLLKKAAAGVLVAIHSWEPQAPISDEPNTYAWDILKKMAAELKSPKAALANIVWRTSYRNVRLWSHHQKFVVTDCARDGRRDVCLFFGGLDLTKGRFDWPGHPILPDPAAPAETASLREALKEAPAGPAWVMKYMVDKRTFDNWYSAEFNGGGATQGNLPDADIYPRQPWHDIHARLDGPAAWDVARSFLKRWLLDREVYGKNGNDTGDNSRAWKTFLDDLMDRGKFIQQWETRNNPGPWSAQVLHSLSRYHAAAPRVNAKWHPKREEFKWSTLPAAGGNADFERSIQNSYLRAIGRAERFIHIENQYFIGSGRRWPNPLASIANDIPFALVDRIIKKHAAKQPFHVYVVLPMMPEGAPGDGAYRGIRHLEWNTIAWMVGAMRAAGIKDWTEYLSFYFQAKSMGATGGKLTWPAAGSKDPVATQRLTLTRQNRRYMIYVHSKLLIVDDRVVILGSANINERSMAGDRDTEICLSLWPSSGAHAKACEDTVRAQLRYPLLHEYLGGAALPNSDKPESPEYRNALAALARQNYLDIRAGIACNGHLAAFPFEVNVLTPQPVVAAWAAQRPTAAEAIANPDALRAFEEHNRLLDSLASEAGSADALGWSWAGVIGFPFSTDTARLILE